MQQLLCATGNQTKFDTGRLSLVDYGIELVQKVIDIPEIQGEDIELIIRDKAQKAFAQLGEPVIVTDDSWTIPGLNGFPGPYMKSIIHWFSLEDFLHLTIPLTDRRIILNQLVAYQDAEQTVVFRYDWPGQLSREPRGNYGTPNMKIICGDMDNGLTVSEVYDAGQEHDPERLKHLSGAWQAFGDWYKEHKL